MQEIKKLLQLLNQTFPTTGGRRLAAYLNDDGHLALLLWLADESGPYAQSVHLSEEDLLLTPEQLHDIIKAELKPNEQSSTNH